MTKREHGWGMSRGPRRLGSLGSRWTLLTWLVLSVAPSVFLVPTSSGQVSEWIKFETTDQNALPIIRARLNGSEGHRLVIDVSLIDNILDNTIVAGSGMELASRNEEKTIDYYGHEESVPIAYLSSLDVGDVTFNTVPVLIVEGDDSTVLGGIRSYGRIGRETLSPIRLTLNFPRGLLLFDASPEGPVPPNGLSFDPEVRFITIPVSVSTPQGDVDVPFVFDVGSSTTVLDRRWAAEQKLSKRGSARVTLDRFRVGGLNKEEFAVALGDMHELPYTGEPLGILGTDLIRDLSVTFDFPRSMIWLQPIETSVPSGPEETVGNVSKSVHELVGAKASSGLGR